MPARRQLAQSMGNGGVRSDASPRRVCSRPLVRQSTAENDRSRPNWRLSSDIPSRWYPGAEGCLRSHRLPARTSRRYQRRPPARGAVTAVRTTDRDARRRRRREPEQSLAVGSLESHRRCVTSDEVHTSARAEADDRAPHRDLHPIDELTVVVYDVINWPAFHVSRWDRSHPDIPIEIGADRAGEKGGLVVRELARRHEGELRLAANCPSATLSGAAVRTELDDHAPLARRWPAGGLSGRRWRSQRLRRQTSARRLHGIDERNFVFVGESLPIERNLRR